MVVSSLRATLALTVGFFLTIFFGVTGCVVSVVARFLSSLSDREIKFVSHIISLWAFLVEKICVKCLLGMKITVDANVKPADLDEILICIGNHPSTLGIPSFTYFVTQYLCRDILAIAKQEHLSNPVVGWLLWLSKSGIFVDRSNSDASRISVENGINDFVHTPCAIVLFPDMRRPSEKLIFLDRERFKGKVPNVERWLRYTLVPRGGAFHVLLNKLRGKKVRIINLTMASLSDDSCLAKVLDLVGGEFHIHAEEVTISVDSREELNKWLNKEWERKNQTITEWRT